MTKAQQTYQRINALVEAGTPKAEAFKQLAAEYGQPVTSVRGAYYGHKRVLERGDEPSSGTRSSSRRSRKRETTTEDAVMAAVASLQASIDSIEVELETARDRASEAQAEYQAMQAASTGRIEAIRVKIAVLDPDAGQRSSEADEVEVESSKEGDEAAASSEEVTGA